MVGIYKITNLINGKIYIGQSVHIEHRFQEHHSEYEQERQKDKPLYKAFQKYGIENFTFEVIEECSDVELNTKEEYWITYYDSLTHHNGYNIRSGGEGNYGENHPRHKLTKEDVIDIRTRYQNHERAKEVEELYKNKIGHSGFSKVWKGETWKNIMPEVYTKENKEFQRCNTGNTGASNGRSLLTEEDVYNIRLRRKNGEKEKDVYNDYKHTGIKERSFRNTWLGYNWKHIVVE